jgi:hypothetical protein
MCARGGLYLITNRIVSKLKSRQSSQSCVHVVYRYIGMCASAGDYVGNNVACKMIPKAIEQVCKSNTYEVEAGNIHSRIY